MTVPFGEALVSYLNSGRASDPDWVALQMQALGDGVLSVLKDNSQYTIIFDRQKWKRVPRAHVQYRATRLGLIESTTLRSFSDASLQANKDLIPQENAQWLHHPGLTQALTKALYDELGKLP